MIPGGSADELLQDQALDIDQRGDVLGILAWQVGQQPLEVEVNVALADFRLQSVLIGHGEIAWWAAASCGGSAAGVASKGRCRVGREVSHPGPSPDPDKEIATIRLFR